MFEDISPIEDFTGNLSLEFVDYSLAEPKYPVDEAKERDVTYNAPLRVKVRLLNKETGEVKEQEVFMGDFPLMTDTGTFIINGAERVIVSQLVRSPSVYFNEKFDKNGKRGYTATVIPNRGAWLEFETDTKDVVHVRIDRTRKLPITVLLRALGFSSNEEIVDLIGDNEYLRNTLEKDNTEDSERALIEIYERLRPGEPPTAENARNLLISRFFDPKRYDLARVGRYKINKKLHIKHRLFNQTLAETIVNEETGEVIARKGDKLTRRLLDKILPYLDLEDHARGENIINPGDGVIDEPIKIQSIKIVDPTDPDGERTLNVIGNANVSSSVKNITPSDIIASINYFFNLLHGVGDVDDIDHLGNRRLRSVGELLQNQFRIGLSRMERVVRERMSTQDPDLATPQALINIRPVVASIKEFFGSSQLSQFMDQTNPLAELTHKRRMSALGPGGLSRDRAGAEVRDVHDSHYGRICPIETPEGPNIGLITSMTTYARINGYGFLETPYRKVDKKTGIVTEEIEYLTADLEDLYIIAQANEPLDENSRFINERVSGRGINGENDIYRREDIDYMDVSPQQIVSVGTAMIPFLENDDATRALMGSNMQRQAVPLIKTDAPIIGTGIEHKAAHDSGVVLLCKNDGVVTEVSGDEIQVTRDSDRRVERYKVMKVKRTEHGTTFNQRPIVRIGDIVKKGDIIADGPSTENGEIALGINILIAFMTWEGYHYEDAMLLNEKLVIDDVLTSLHIEEHECEARETKLGPEELTRDIPNIGDRKSVV